METQHYMRQVGNSDRFASVYLQRANEWMPKLRLVPTVQSVHFALDDNHQPHVVIDVNIDSPLTKEHVIKRINHPEALHADIRLSWRERTTSTVNCRNNGAQTSMMKARRCGKFRRVTRKVS
jgi:hypothetical protein